jgi:hypothetical protein
MALLTKLRLLYLILVMNQRKMIVMRGNSYSITICCRNHLCVAYYCGLLKLLLLYSNRVTQDFCWAFYMISVICKSNLHLTVQYYFLIIFWGHDSK